MHVHIKNNNREHEPEKLAGFPIPHIMTVYSDHIICEMCAFAPVTLICTVGQNFHHGSFRIVHDKNFLRIEPRAAFA